MTVDLFHACLPTLAVPAASITAPARSCCTPSIPSGSNLVATREIDGLLRECMPVVAATPSDQGLFHPPSLTTITVKGVISRSRVASSSVG